VKSTLEPIITLLLQNSNSAQGRNGHMPLLGAFVGVVVGALAGLRPSPNGKSGRITSPAAWAGLAGFIVFAIATVLDSSNSNVAVVGPVVESGAVGAITCGLWGLLGGAIGRIMHKGDAAAAWDPAAGPGGGLRPKIPPPSSIRCYRCKADIAVTPELIGKKTKCPNCGTKQQLPR
jgi:hypothetical protein